MTKEEIVKEMETNARKIKDLELRNSELRDIMRDIGREEAEEIVDRIRSNLKELESLGFSLFVERNKFSRSPLDSPIHSDFIFSAIRTKE